MRKKSTIAKAVLFLFLGLGILQCTGSRKELTRADEYKRERKILQELQYGKVIALRIIRQYSLLDDAKATLYVNKVGKSVALFSGRSDFEYRFGILDTNHINAYAAPGGYIFVTKGAILAMKNEGQLAAVLAHEIAHVNLKHILKELPPPRDTGGLIDRTVAVLSSRGTTVSAAMSQAAEKAMVLLLSKGLKIEAEFAADATALAYLSETGYSAAALKNYLKIINKKFANNSAPEKKKTKVYDTHPPLLKRILKIENIIVSDKLPTKRPSVKNRFIINLGHLTK